MRGVKAVSLFLVAAAVLTNAQGINVSGVVKDTSGSPVQGAVVRLENIGTVVSTDVDGKFVIGNPVQVAHGSPILSPASLPFSLRGNLLTVSVQRPRSITVNVFAANGCRLTTRKSRLMAGTHTMTLPQLSNGLHVYQLLIDDLRYVCTSVGYGTFDMGTATYSAGTGGVATSAAVEPPASDVLSVAKTGWLPYRDSVSSAETEVLQITLIPSAGVVVDADGNEYQTVKIGNQVWTTEDLRTTTFNDGGDIPHVTSSSIWGGLTTPAYCFYLNRQDHAVGLSCGALYNWYAVQSGKLAPNGWRVPTDADWDTLRTCLIGAGMNYDGTTSGNKIGKALAARIGWTSCSGSGSNCSEGAVGDNLRLNDRTGFSAQPCGSRLADGTFTFEPHGSYSNWWSATEKDTLVYAGYHFLQHGQAYLYSSNTKKKKGLLVRLVRDR